MSELESVTVVVTRTIKETMTFTYNGEYVLSLGHKYPGKIMAEAISESKEMDEENWELEGDVDWNSRITERKWKE